MTLLGKIPLNERIKQGSKAWDRLIDETLLSFSCFCVYLEAPPNERSVARAELLYKTRNKKPIPVMLQLEKPKPSATVGRWSSKNYWLKRHEAYWEYVNAEAVKKTERKRVKGIIDAKTAWRQSAQLNQSSSLVASAITQHELKAIYAGIQNKTITLTVQELSRIGSLVDKLNKAALEAWQIVEPEEFAIKQQVELSFADQIKEKLKGNIEDIDGFMAAIDAGIISKLLDEEKT